MTHPATVGFGGYRITNGSAEHALALQAALDLGIRIVDTASTYEGGASEMLIGSVLDQCGGTTTEVTTKVGMVQHHTLDLFRELERSASTPPPAAWSAESFGYSLHPTFIAKVVEQSYQRLRTSSIVVLLHNPEILLQLAHSAGKDATTASAEMYSQIEKAFAWLEQEYANKRIVGYGISSNTLCSAPTVHDAISIDTVADIARQVGGSMSGFNHIQVPFNVLEHDAATQPVSNSTTLLESAQELSLHVSTNRPLNAIINSSLIRLVSYPLPDIPVDAAVVEQSIHRLEVVEHELLQQIVTSLQHNTTEAETVTETFRIAGALCQTWNSFDSIVMFRDVRRQHLQPRVTIASRYQLAQQYVQQITNLLDSLDVLYAQEEVTSLEGVRSMLCSELDLPANTPLQHLAIHAARCTDGVDTVLVGMRSRAYVQDVHTAMQLPSRKYSRQTWQSIATQLSTLSDADPL